MSYVLFWISKVVVEIAIVLAIIFVVFCLLAPGLIKQLRCKHEEYRETPACDAICKKCGKNLGFIGSLRGGRM